jgi:opacity protein-like surface antigen
MNKTATSFCIAALLALGAAAPAAAQELMSGTWTGTMAPPGAAGVPVTFDVGEAGGALSIVMRSAQVEGEMPFKDVRIEGGELTFWWDPGVRVNCTLERTPNGSFEGPCAGESGPEGAGRITMVPPNGNDQL